MSALVVPLEVTQNVERFVTKLHNDAEKWDNVELLDESQVYSLHIEVAAIYQRGYEDGLAAQMERDRYAANRRDDRKRAATEASA